MLAKWLTSHVFMTGSSFAAIARPNIGWLLPFPGNQEVGVLSSLMITFKVYGSQVLDKDIPGT